MRSSFRQIVMIVALSRCQLRLAVAAPSTRSSPQAWSDYVPHWAGGLPADAPPRPGTAKYDAFMGNASGGADAGGGAREDSKPTQSAEKR